MKEKEVKTEPTEENVNSQVASNETKSVNQAVDGRDLKQRVSAMRKYILSDIAMCVMGLLFCIGIACPIMSLFGQTETVFDLISQFVDSKGSAYSTIGMMVVDTFGVTDASTILGVGLGLSLLMVIFPLMVGLVSLIRLIKLALIYKNCEKVLSSAEAGTLNQSRRSKGRNYNGSCIAGMVVSLATYCILFAFLNKGGNPLVQATTLVLYCISMACFIGLALFRYYYYKDNKDITKDKANFSIYR